jgi:hypothetical protein
MARRRHPAIEIEDALRHAESSGWRVSEGGSHAWGRMFCPTNDGSCGCDEFCITSIWSTPRSAGNHARQLKRVVDRCVLARANSARGDANEEAGDA